MNVEPVAHIEPGENLTYTVAAVYYRGQQALFLSLAVDENGNKTAAILPIENIIRVPLPSDDLSFVVVEK